MFAFCKPICYNAVGGGTVTKLNDASNTIYQFILLQQQRNGFPPTIREICEGVG